MLRADQFYIYIYIIYNCHGHTLINEKLVTHSQGHISILKYFMWCHQVCAFDPSFETEKSFGQFLPNTNRQCWVKYGFKNNPKSPAAYVPADDPSVSMPTANSLSVTSLTCSVMKRGEFANWLPVITPKTKHKTRMTSTSTIAWNHDKYMRQNIIILPTAASILVCLICAWLARHGHVIESCRRWERPISEPISWASEQ